MRRKTILLISSIAFAVLSIVAGVASNVAAGELPQGLEKHLWISWPVLLGASAALFVLQMVMGKLSEPGSTAPSARWRAFSRRSLLGTLARRVGEELAAAIPGGQLIDVRLGPDGLDDDVRLTGILWERKGVLITGDPGAGKTTTVLRLLQTLLAQAADNDDLPIPVMFRLASWTGDHARLEDWLVERLTGENGVHRDVAAAWVAHEEILPLLDGLDEVGLGRRAGCVRAINAFHAAHRLLPLAVTSRATEYTALRVRLGVAVTLQLQPLSQSQVEDYLQRLGTPALIADPALRELLPTPLLLSLAVRTYRARPEQVAVGQGSVPERRQQLVGTFVRQALRVSPEVPDAQERGPLRHIAYLARALALQPGSTFHVEFISRSWLPPAGRFAVGAATALPAALLAAIAGFTAAGLVFPTGRALLIAALLAVGCAIPVFLVDGDVPAPATGHPLRLPAAMTGIWALTSLAGGMLGGVAGGLAGLVHMLLTEGWQNQVPGGYLGVGAFTGLLLGVLPAFLQDDLVGSRRHLADLPPGGGLAAEAGLSLRILLVAGAAAALFATWRAGLAGAPAGALLGLLAAYLRSGRRLVAHWSTRLLLARRGLLPRRPVPFLQTATAGQVLIQAGGGFRFAHRLLLEHFARTHLPEVPAGYRLGGLPVADLQPDLALDRARALVHGDAPDTALIALRFAGFCLPAQQFAPAALEVATALEPPPGARATSDAAVQRFVAAHEMVIDAGDPDLSAASARRVADLLVTATTDDPNIEQKWRDAARRFYWTTAASGHPVHAPHAVHRLTTASFKVPPQRFAAWEEEQRRRQSEANTYYPV